MAKLKLYAFADEAGAPLQKQIDALRRNGLDGIEVRNVDGTNISDLSQSDCKALRRVLDDAGLVTWSIGSPIGKIDVEKDDYGAHLEKLCRTLENAAILGTKQIRLFSFYLPKGGDAARYRDTVIDRMNEMTKICLDAGVVPCHENEKGIYGDNAERCLDLYRSVPGLSGVFDPANFVQCGVDVTAAWDLLSPYIRYLHIKDARAENGNIVPAGQGDGKIAQIIRAFRQNGGEGLTLEPHLTVFDGLSALERSGEESRVGTEYSYPDADTAFDAACDALKSILSKELLS